MTMSALGTDLSILFLQEANFLNDSGLEHLVGNELGDFVEIRMAGLKSVVLEPQLCPSVVVFVFNFRVGEKGPAGLPDEKLGFLGIVHDDDTAHLGVLHEKGALVTGLIDPRARNSGLFRVRDLASHRLFAHHHRAGGAKAEEEEGCEDLNENRGYALSENAQETEDLRLENIRVPLVPCLVEGCPRVRFAPS